MSLLGLSPGHWLYNIPVSGIFHHPVMTHSGEKTAGSDQVLQTLDGGATTIVIIQGILTHTQTQSRLSIILVWNQNFEVWTTMEFVSRVQTCQNKLNQGVNGSRFGLKWTKQSEYEHTLTLEEEGGGEGICWSTSVPCQAGSATYLTWLDFCPFTPHLTEAEIITLHRHRSSLTHIHHVISWYRTPLVPEREHSTWTKTLDH